MDQRLRLRSIGVIRIFRGFLFRARSCDLVVPVLVVLDETTNSRERTQKRKPRNYATIRKKAYVYPPIRHTGASLRVSRQLAYASWASCGMTNPGIRLRLHPGLYAVARYASWVRGA